MGVSGGDETNAGDLLFHCNSLAREVVISSTVFITKTFAKKNPPSDLNLGLVNLSCPEALYPPYHIINSKLGSPSRQVMLDL